MLDAVDLATPPTKAGVKVIFFILSQDRTRFISILGILRTAMFNTYLCLD